MNQISWEEFSQVELRIGTILQAEEFPEARKPAYKLLLDFGPGLGHLKSSAQITDLYSPESLVGKQVLAVVNFPPQTDRPFSLGMSGYGILQPGESSGTLRPRP